MSVFSFVLFILLQACERKAAVAEQPFSQSPDTITIMQAPAEISGIAASKKMPGALWAHEDSNNPPWLYLIGANGQLQHKVFLKGISNRDWEELCFTGTEIYLADIGDNNAVHNEYFLYRFAEPDVATDTVRQISTIRFQYPDGPHDAEAFWVDATNGDVFVISKREAASRVYRIPSPHTGNINFAELVAVLPYTGVVACTLSTDGKEFIVKTYQSLYYYRLGPNQSVQAALAANKYLSLFYVQEPQGEAVCFAQDGSGFYTVSEQARAGQVKRYFYRRK